MTKKENNKIHLNTLKLLMGLNRLVYCNDFQTDSIASKYLHRNTQ